MNEIKIFRIGAQKSALSKGVDEKCSIRPVHIKSTAYNNAGLIYQAERTAETVTAYR
jgi:hypothetical protein